MPGGRPNARLPAQPGLEDKQPSQIANVRVKIAEEMNHVEFPHEINRTGDKQPESDKTTARHDWD